jgi:hypothetical protein
MILSPAIDWLHDYTKILTTNTLLFGLNAALKTVRIGKNLLGRMDDQTISMDY